MVGCGDEPTAHTAVATCTGPSCSDTAMELAILWPLCQGPSARARLPCWGPSYRARAVCPHPAIVNLHPRLTMSNPKLPATGDAQPPWIYAMGDD